ncbi:Protein of unknown function [Gryllus bimaculatus]|nr:Protein of unknown function [Gryllus bimaculatus]
MRRELEGRAGSQPEALSRGGTYASRLELTPQGAQRNRGARSSVPANASRLEGQEPSASQRRLSSVATELSNALRRGEPARGRAVFTGGAVQPTAKDAGRCAAAGHCGPIAALVTRGAAHARPGEVSPLHAPPRASGAASFGEAAKARTRDAIARRGVYMRPRRFQRHCRLHKHHRTSSPPTCSSCSEKR